MKRLLLSVVLYFVFCNVFSQAANNTCNTAQNLGTLTGIYTATPGDLYLANQTNLGTCGNRYDVWYQFTLPAASNSVTISVVLNLPSNLSNTNTYIELFSVVNNCATTPTGTTLAGCNNISVPRRYTGLTAGGTYYFRVNTTVNPNSLPSTSWDFNVFVVPGNDECNNLATTLIAGTSVDGTVLGATNSSVAAAPCSGTPDDDVWYKFDALYSYATITLSNIGADLNTSGARMQLFSGTCASLTSIACGTASNAINATGLTPGNTYFIRVYSAGTNPQTGTAWGFRISLTPSNPTVVGSGRMREVFLQQIISPPQVLADPWEITYGPDNNLWVTESKGYRVYKINPETGLKDTVLNISQGSTFLPPADQTFNCQFNNGAGAQGGLAGLALHPRFLAATSPKNFVYVSYIHSQTNASYFTNRIVRFTYNTVTGKLESPVSLCDTLPGSNDHNSQRMIIRPMTAGGTDYYLFYASGDMGAGQGSATNRARVIKSQFPNSYEGKILRFNLEPDGDAGLNAWIPSSIADPNPYNSLLGVQSAVWNIGQRNNQGFAYDSVLNILYGSSHGPYSDDEINIMEGFKNYGHPLVIGYVADGNYDGNTNPGSASNNLNISAGAPYSNPAADFGNSSCPPIGSEATRRAEIDMSGNGLYKDPLFSAYPETAAGPGSVRNIWQTTTGANGQWPSEGWSGLDLYTHTLIPGWKNSLIAASLKWGRLLRLKLGSSGTTVVPTNGQDTVSYFGSINRFRDLAFAPNGKDVFVVMDRSTSTSGPSTANPIVPSCQGCLQKYTFLGYNDVAGTSNIPTSIPVDSSTSAGCVTATAVTINAANANNNLWVPITGPNGNIIAEIKANGNNLGNITTSFFTRTGNPVRSTAANSKYLNRNVTINTSNAPSSAVSVRLYITAKELADMIATVGSGVTGINDVGVFKNNDACGTAIIGTGIGQSIAGRYVQSTFGHAIQFNVTSFSSFYFFNNSTTLPFDLITFTGKAVNDAAKLQWVVNNEENILTYTVERSTDGVNFEEAGTVTAKGTQGEQTYYFTDFNAARLGSVLYYRIRSNELTGAGRYTNTISVNFIITSVASVNLVPNPVAAKTNVLINAIADETAQLKVVDNIGRVVKVMNVQLVKGKNTIVLDVSSYRAGLYYIDISGKAINEQVKLIKQ
jgi:trimeric autotransporter adhesin